MSSAGIARGAFASSLMIFSTTALADPVEWHEESGGNGHFYEVIKVDDISWANAKAAAESRFHNGVQGHLATLTSAAENSFVAGLRDAALPVFPLRSEAWVGGFQTACTPEPGCGWQWVNEEGAIPTPHFPGPGFSNWQLGEPNDALGEQHLTLGRYTDGLWNDSDEANGHIGGYIVEFDGVANANDCTASAGGCNPSGVQAVQIPDSVVLEPDDTLTQALVESAPGQFRFTDPRVDSNGRCTLTADGFGGTANPRQSLDVFGDGSLILPPWLCGSPQFAVIRSDATFKVLEDVIRHEQFAEEIFSASETFPCEGLTGDTDLQRRAVFGWQPDDRSTVPEEHALELTNGCGSSRGATASPSWFLLNLHIDCGIVTGNVAAIRQCFVDLVNAKYESLRQVLKNAKESLQGTNYGSLQSALSSSQSHFQLANYAVALQRLSEFIALTETATFNDPAFNHQGHLLMRAENLRFTIDDKIDP